MPKRKDEPKAAKALWLRRDNETAKAYEAFSAYLKMDAKRSIEAVSRRYSKSVGLLNRWSRRHSWTERTKAYDEHLRQIEQAAIDRTAEKGAIDWQKERNRIRMEALQNSKLLVKKAIAMLNFPLVRKSIKGGKTIVEPVRWTMSDAVKFIETADKLQRLAAEMETSNDKVTLVDEQAQVEKAIEKFIVETGTNREEAIKYLAPLMPGVSKYVN